MPTLARRNSRHVVWVIFVSLLSTGCYFQAYHAFAGSLMAGTSGGRTNTTCLADPGSGVKTISLQMCGNGIVEDGEDCDPGKGSTSSCCDVNTCKFKSGAVCDPASSPCCTDSCSFAPTTQVCRPAKDAQCDQAEMCTGNSSACPTDVFSPNGKFLLS